MDQKTISSYNKSATAVANIHDNLTPQNIYKTIQLFFIKGGLCADIGCGAGRDIRWLRNQGFQVVGIDASEKMLVEAKKRCSKVTLIHDSLPMLNLINDSTYMNVLCSAVIMHLKEENIRMAVENLLRVTQSGGVILISFRGTNNINHRENEKLYTPIITEELILIFIESGATLMHEEINHEMGRDLKWINLVFKK